MSSLKMTFSLTSLILIFAFAFVAVPVIAAPDGATVSIAAYTGKVDGSGAPAEDDATGAVDYMATRANFIVTVTLSKPAALTTSHVTVRKSAGANEVATEITGSTVAQFPGSINQRKWTVQINMADTEYEMSRLVVSVAADAFMDLTADPKGNQASTGGTFTNLPKANDWTVTPTLDADDGPEVADGKFTVDATDPNTFTVEFTLSGGTGAVPDLTASATQIQIRADDNGMPGDILPSGQIAAATPTQSGLVAAVVYTPTAIATPVHIGINPNWAAGTTLQIPAAGDPGKTDVNPTVDIALFGTVNEAAKTFEVKFAFAEATVDASTQTAVAVPDMLTAGQITLQKQDPADTMAMIDSDAYVEPNGIIKTRDGVFLVTINYRADALPVYVGTSVGVSATTIGGMAPTDADNPTLMVGMTQPMNNAPVFTEGATAMRSIAEDAAVGANVGAAVTATDDDNDTLTYSLDTASDASFDIDAMGQITTAVALDFETTPSYTATVSASDGTDSASITVTITVTDVDEAPPNMNPVFAANLPTTIMGKSGVAITPVTFAATDSDGGTLAYSWDVDETALGLMLGPATGTVSGTPNKAHMGSHPITVVDGQGGSATHPLTITIQGNNAPTFAPFTFPALTAGTAHPVTLPEATDADGDTLTYSISGLPAGLMASTDTSMPLTISGAATTAGTTSVTYTASDNRGGEATLSLTITVNAAPEDPKDPPPGAPGAPNNLAAMVNDNDTVTLTWTEPAGTITGYVVGITEAGATTGSTSTIRGRASTHTTAILTAGAYTVTVAARNAAGLGGSASVSFTIAAAPPIQPTVPAIILPTGIPNVGGSFAAGTGRVVGETTLSGSIAANSFGVVLADNLPDLENFFRQKGTIVLTDNVSAAGENLGTRAVLISEILWGLDAGEPAGMQDRRQFIELYNTNTGTTGSVDVTGWKLVFTLHRPAPANVVDRVSNAGTAVDPGWFMDIGQSGVLTGTTLAGATALGGTGVPVDIISAYRDINYNAVQGDGDRLKADHVRWGHQKGSWKATTRITTQVGIKASPGARHFVELGPLTKTGVSRSPFVINEIGNATGGANDWIELRNVTDVEQSLKNRQLSVVTSDKKDTVLFHFHDQDWKVPAGGVILIASTDPSTNDLAGGNNLARGDLDEVLEGATHIYVVPTKGLTRSSDGGSFNIPDSGKTLLILRNNHEAKHLGTGDHIADWIGTLSIQDTGRGTNLWPLYVWGGPHGNVVKNGDEDFRAGKVYQRNNTNADGKEAIEIRGYTGLGYDRHADANGGNGGTPGYQNGDVKHKYSDFSGQISVSEIMLVTEETGQAGRVPRATRLPQWIELYNNSMTQAVTISNWHLEIQNDDTDGFLGNLHGTLRLKDIVIQPNQTVLIVSNSGLSSGNFPAQRTINVFLDGTYRRELGLVNRGDQILNPAGFYIELRDHENRPVDEIGNLGVSRRTGTGRRDNFGEQWELPDMNSVDGHRTSLIRIYDNDTARNGLNPVGGPDDPSTSWILASNTNFRNVPSLTYYGNHRDFGTPGYRGGGPLPVGLSKFRPERLESGEIVIRWITSSELNNAGFNILRSETKDGQFTKVNTQLIAGQGTTSEKTSYEWKDTTAKPNVVYYYQIQDVSIDGDVTTLRTTRLRGHISPTGKATTTWGELKALQ